MPGVVTQSVLKTGHDAFQAKASFVSAGYASSVINRNHDDYVRYTESIANLLESKPRKQTALVNIGYAARVAVVTRAIEHFISSSFSLSPINLIIIGCGLDPLGMWSLTLSSSVNVIEIDCDDFASMKSTFHSSILPQPCLSRICTVTCDLQSGDSVSLGLESVKNRIDFTAPTMVVSELVLIYLSNVPDLLHTFVGLFPDLTLAAFEPFCPAERHENQTIVRSESTATTAENDFNAHRRGFEAAYLDRFREKVKELHGMGSRPSEVRRLLMRQGFLKDSIIVERAGRRFFDAVGGKFKALEPFDEHAGLALYLRSYFFCECRSRGELLKRDFAVKTIETDLEEEEAREIFKFSYESHGKKYKSVAKMVKSAIRCDMDNIRSHYAASDRCFKVAIDPYSSSVVGCVAVSFCSFRKGYEINRLCVRKDFRGLGVGRMLLNSAEEFARKREAGSLLFAVTPVFAKDAHALYEKMSFEKNVAFRVENKGKEVDLTVFSKCT